MPKTHYDVDWYFVKMELKAFYVLTVPAQSKEEALGDAYRVDIPFSRLYESKKTREILQVFRRKEIPGQERLVGWARQKDRRVKVLHLAERSQPVGQGGTPSGCTSITSSLVIGRWTLDIELADRQRAR